MPPRANLSLKNRMRETRTSGSVRGGGGNVPTYSADQAADELLGGALLVGERLQLMHQAFGMDPTCVRRSPGKENGDDLKPFNAFQRVRTPSRQRRSPPAGSEPCMGGGDATREA